MKIKIFKCIMNGENAVECTLHADIYAAIKAGLDFTANFGPVEPTWERAITDLEKKTVTKRESWNDYSWVIAFNLFLERSQRIMGVNTVTIEDETIEVPDVKSLHGFKGERIGVMDVTGLSEKALAVIRNFAWKCEDEGEPDFNFYHCDENCFWENVPENYRMSKKTRTELNRFLAFMSANECWWARFIEW